jgi:hypothetical protein
MIGIINVQIDLFLAKAADKTVRLRIITGVTEHRRERCHKLKPKFGSERWQKKAP